MFEWIDPIMKDAKLQVDIMISDTIGVKCDKESECDSFVKNTLYKPFKLPIQYLPESDIHPLSETVNQDLELVKSVGSKSVYQQLFKPTHNFGEMMINEWEKQFTTNIQYLLDTQQVIREMNYIPKCDVKHDLLMTIWDDVKRNSDEFLEKYCYIEWDIIKSLNHSSGFLQVLSMINMMSPVISLMLPVLFLVLPFIILKIRGLQITAKMYIDVLRDIAKHHFIGKIINGLSSLSIENLIYLVLVSGFYFFQIYQNIISCKRFYQNMVQMRQYLYEIKTYLGNSIQTMEHFINRHCEKESYTTFCADIRKHIHSIKEYLKLLILIEPPTTNLVYDIGNIGYMSQCYYELHSNKQFDESIRYSFGFEGFMDNLRGINSHYNSGYVSPAIFDTTSSCEFKKQYYPGHMNDDNCVKNNCGLNKKMIITGPNASGKTTILKSTTINVICSQQIGCGFYKSAILNPYTHIHSYLNIPDTSERDSLFQAESRRCKEIIDSIKTYTEKDGYRHYGIFDELYSGTNPEEATNSGFAFLKYLSKFNNVDFILTTHYTKICTKFKKHKNIRNYKMDVIQDESGKIQFTYKMKKGISKIKGAVRILENMEYPPEIINCIKNES